MSILEYGTGVTIPRNGISPLSILDHWCNITKKWHFSLVGASSADRNGKILFSTVAQTSHRNGITHLSRDADGNASGQNKLRQHGNRIGTKTKATGEERKKGRKEKKRLKKARKYRKKENVKEGLTLTNTKTHTKETRKRQKQR